MSIATLESIRANATCLGEIDKSEKIHKSPDVSAQTLNCLGCHPQDKTRQIVFDTSPLIAFDGCFLDLMMARALIHASRRSSWVPSITILRAIVKYADTVSKMILAMGVCNFP